MLTKTRDSIHNLALHASTEFVISQDQAKRILQDVIVRSTKREHHASRLTFLCMKLEVNKVKKVTRPKF